MKRRCHKDYWVGLDPDPEARPDHVSKLRAFAELVATWEASRAETGETHRPTLAPMAGTDGEAS